MYVYLLTVFLKYSKASFELMSVAMYLVKFLPILHSYVSLASHACLIIFKIYSMYTYFTMAMYVATYISVYTYCSL